MFQADISVARKLNKLLKERVLFVAVVGVVFFWVAVKSTLHRICLNRIARTK